MNYSVKANGNLTIVRIAREEGLKADAMSPGEMYLEELAGYKPEDILYISNNVPQRKCSTPSTGASSRASIL